MACAFSDELQGLDGAPALDLRGCASPTASNITDEFDGALALALDRASASPTASNMTDELQGLEGEFGRLHLEPDGAAAAPTASTVAEDPLDGELARVVHEVKAAAGRNEVVCRQAAAAAAALRRELQEAKARSDQLSLELAEVLADYNAAKAMAECNEEACRQAAAAAVALRRELDQVQEDLAAANARSNQLLQDLRQELESAHLETGAASSRCTKLELELKVATSNTNEALANLQELRQELESAQLETTAASSRCTKLELELKVATSNTSDLQQTLKDAQRKLEDARSEVATTSSSCECLVSELQTAHTTSRNLLDQLQKACSEKATLTTRYSNIQAELEEAKDANARQVGILEQKMRAVEEREVMIDKKGENLRKQMQKFEQDKNTLRTWRMKLQQRQRTIQEKENVIQSAVIRLSKVDEGCSEGCQVPDVPDAEEMELFLPVIADVEQTAELEQEVEVEVEQSANLEQEEEVEVEQPAEPEQEVEAAVVGCKCKRWSMCRQRVCWCGANKIRCTTSCWCIPEKCTNV